jgi:Mce-associated membrane protein
MTTGVEVQGEEPCRAPTEASPEELAVLAAAKAAQKAERAQRKAEKARRLADEYARLAATGVAADAPAPDAPAAAAPVAPSRRPLVVSGIALGACLVFAVVALVLYLTSGGSPDSSAGSVRDSALLSARQDIVVLNTLDYRSVDAGLARWAAASTGTLHNQLSNVTAAEKQHIASAKAVTTAKVLDAALVSLDAGDGSATVIASAEITVTPASGKAVVKRERLRADLTRVQSAWKVNSIEQVGVTVP